MLPKYLRRTLATLPVLAGLGGVVLAQRLPQSQPLLPAQPAVPAPPAVADDGVEVLARGPVHEAFASTAEMPTGGGPVVDKRPPDPVEELPPDQKPDGDNVQWIPGYWSYDEERKDFIWISGFWRAAPPGRVWVPGGWQEVRGGFQWVNGFWNVAAQGAAHADIEYLPPPPQTLEAGPTVVSPGDDYFYTPGSWVYRTNRYVWRPGFWVPHRHDWMWVPDHYRWTPCGYVFVPGYWDVPLDRRGVLFAPVYFAQRVFVRPRFVYTPVYAVPAPSLYTSLFFRTGHAGYYFGDYYGQRYVTAGYTSWAAASFRGTNFAVTVGVGRGFTYDPLWNYYSVAYRGQPAWQANITNVYVGRYKGDMPRPPHTLVQQNTVVNNVTNVTNVTNNTTVIVNNNTTNKTVAAAAPVAMLTPLKDLKQASPTVALKAVTPDDRVKEQKLAKDIQKVATERRATETKLMNAGAVVAKADDKPRQVKVDLPKAVVARAQAPADPVKAPPPPAAPGQKKAEPPAKIPPATADHAKPVVPMHPTDPKLLPKVDPPKGVTPLPLPTTPGTPPKVDPKVPVTPVKPADPPKIDLKPVGPAPVVVPPKLPLPVPTVSPAPVVPSPTPPKADVHKPLPLVGPPTPSPGSAGKFDPGRRTDKPRDDKKKEDKKKEDKKDDKK